MNDLTVVIVNYRVKYFLEQTLASVVEATAGMTTQIVVVDNASGDDSIDYCRRRFPDVTYVENNENVGFSRANNQAIMAADSLFTLILNPDTVVTKRCLDECRRLMAEEPDCAAVGVHMVDGDGVFLPESKRAYPSPWVSFCKIFGLSALFPRSPLFAKYHLRYLDERKPHRVDILSGAFMFCRTERLQAVGGFDEDFFMYGEDIDLSYRLAQKGWHNRYLPVDIIHYKGESTKKDSMRYVKVFYDAMLIFYRKHFPRARWFFYPFIKLGVLVRMGAAMLRRLLPKGKRANAVAAPWTIVSDRPQEVAEAVKIAEFNTALITDGPENVLLDNSTMTYSDIVDFIVANSRRQRSFHIYSDAARVVISPKISQQ